jgi:hypothetical protein
MSFRPDHELHRRRLGRNLGIGGALLAFVILVFGMTIEKVHMGTPASAMLGEDTVSQPSTGAGTGP